MDAEAPSAFRPNPFDGFTRFAVWTCYQFVLNIFAKIARIFLIIQ